MALKQEKEGKTNFDYSDKPWESKVDITSAINDQMGEKWMIQCPEAVMDLGPTNPSRELTTSLLQLDNDNDCLRRLKCWGFVISLPLAATRFQFYPKSLVARCLVALTQR